MKAPDTQGSILYSFSGNLFWQLYENSAAVIILNNAVSTTGSPDFYNDEWQHLTLVTNGTSSIIYLNGNVIGSDNDANANIPSGNKNLMIGDYFNNQDTWWNCNGSIDEVMIFNRTLSADEIKNLYIRGADRLNVSAQSCDDASCSGDDWTEVDSNSTFGRVFGLGNLSNNRYFRYHNGCNYFKVYINRISNTK